jgi:hypothetical protein
MATKTLIFHRLLPLGLIVYAITFPTLRALCAITYINLIPPKFNAVDRAAPREIQKIFNRFNVEIELTSFQLAGAQKFLKFNVPLGINIPFWGHWQHYTTVLIKGSDSL